MPVLQQLGAFLRKSQNGPNYNSMKTRLEKQAAQLMTEYFVSEEYGFLSPEPAEKQLHPDLQEWNDLATNIADAIDAKEIRGRVEALQLPAELPQLSFVFAKLAHLQLSSIASAYVWCEGESNAPPYLPKQLAVPLYHYSAQIGYQPIVIHACLVLNNWRLIDKTKPFVHDNLQIISAKFCKENAIDKFFLVTAQMEKEFGPAISPLTVSLCIEDREPSVELDELAIEMLQTVERIITQLKTTLRIIFDTVDSTVFFGKIRPYLAGYVGGPYAENGFTFEGVSDEPMRLHGGSAAQSSIFTALDAFLGVRHDGPSGHFVNKMVAYMPVKHQAFVHRLRTDCFIRGYCLKSTNSDVVQAYNSCVDTLVDYRTNHIIMITRYILLPNRKQTTDYKSISAKGTGGTNIMGFLKEIRTNTEAVKIPVGQGSHNSSASDQ